MLASQPERTADMRLTANVQGMPTPATVTQYPDGAFGAKLTDKGCFFYTLLTLKFLVKYQRLPRIWGEELGLGPGWFDVYILVMAMGNWLSAAALAHVEIMRRLARGPILLREPSAQPARRQRAYALAEQRSNDGFLRVDEVPFLFANELKQAGHPTLSGRRVIYWCRSTLFGSRSSTSLRSRRRPDSSSWPVSTSRPGSISARSLSWSGTSGRSRRSATLLPRLWATPFGTVVLRTIT
jgi:hypothetical protein